MRLPNLLRWLFGPARSTESGSCYVPGWTELLPPIESKPRIRVPAGRGAFMDPDGARVAYDRQMAASDARRGLGTVIPWPGGRVEPRFVESTEPPMPLEPVPPADEWVSVGLVLDAYGRPARGPGYSDFDPAEWPAGSTCG